MLRSIVCCVCDRKGDLSVTTRRRVNSVSGLGIAERKLNEEVKMGKLGRLLRGFIAEFGIVRRDLHSKISAAFD